jgi:hypothetical protein
MKFMLFMIVSACLVTAGILAVDRAVSGPLSLTNFSHWTIQSHWTNPVTRQVTILLDEEAVTGTDAKCEAVMHMLDQLTRMVPGWTVKLISPTGWVPVRWNPIDRQGVEWMLKDDPADDDERGPERVPPPAYRYTMRTSTSH